MGFTGRAALYKALTQAELVEWETLHDIDPWTSERQDLAIGVLASLTDACHRVGGHPEPPITYMPVIKKLVKGGRQSTASMRATMKDAVAGFARARQRLKDKPAKPRIVYHHRKHTKRKK